jgi:transposase-like protein
VIHRCRNLVAKVPTHAQDEVKQSFWQVFDDVAAEPGEAAVACLTDCLAELTCSLVRAGVLAQDPPH